MIWLTMPVALLRCYTDALPRLEAEEGITQSSVIAYGTGNMDKQGSARFGRRLRHFAGGQQEPKGPSKPAGKSFVSRLFGGRAPGRAQRKAPVNG